MSSAPRQAWRLARDLSVTCLVGGALLALVGARLAAWIVFGCGFACAVAAGLLHARER